MKIAHVTSTFPPYWAGTGNVAFHNARIMHALGHEVTVFTAQLAGDALVTPFQTERLPALFRFGNAPMTPQLVTKLETFDVIHLHYPYIFGAELALVAAKVFHIPLVLTYHNQLQESHRVKRFLFKLYNLSSEPLLLHSATRLLAVNREHLLSLHPQFEESSHVLELPNGVDTHLFKVSPKQQARHDLNVDFAGPVALFVGALDQAHRFKNVDGLLRAFAQTPVPDAQLWIVGDGDLRAGLQDLSQSLGLEGRVRFWGKHPPDKLPPLFAAADVTVLPSSGVESFGVVLIESLACGTPVIASNLPGVRKVVKHGHDGLLVRPDLRDLPETLTCLLQQPSKAQAMGLKGVQKVAQKYSWEVIGARLESIYEEVISSRLAPQPNSAA